MVDLKELKKLIKYLRQEGVTEFKNGDLEFKLGSTPTKTHKTKSAPAGQVDVSDQVNDITTDEPTIDEMLFWSAGGAAVEPKKDS